jgi:hypothetical protein
LEWQQLRQKKKDSLNEDANCVIAVPTNQGMKELLCFIEADNGSEPEWQIREKTSRYLSYYQQHKQPFRVLFVAPDKKRAQELVRIAQRSIPQEVARMFLFASIQEFKVDPFGPICSICHDKKPVSLFPNSAIQKE